MADFFEIDFLDVEAKDSGDAICLRYELAGETYIHVVDGGYQKTGQSVVDHINKYYGNPTFIDNVVCTHNDGDHAGGLQSVLESFDVGALKLRIMWQWRYRFYSTRSLGNLPRRSRAQRRPTYARFVSDGRPHVIPIQVIDLLSRLEGDDGAACDDGDGLIGIVAAD